MKIVVMGGGVIGVTTAYELACDGHDVTVLDRQPQAASETSFANAGLIAPGHAYTWASPRVPKILLKSLFRDDQAFKLRLRADPRMWAWLSLFIRQCTVERARLNTIRKLRLCLYSQERLHEVVSATGVAYDGRGGGLLYFYRTQAGFERGIANSTILREHGLPLEIVDRDRVAKLEPALAPLQDRIAGAIYAPSDESGDAHIFTCALAEYCRDKLGVCLTFETTIRGLVVQGERVEHIVIDTGKITADAYVLALGCDSPSVARQTGIRLPIYPVKGYSVTIPVRLGDTAPHLGGVDEEHLLAYARIGDRLRLTAKAEFAGYDRSHRPEDFRHLLQVARDLFPTGGDYANPCYWAGLRPMTPEGTPLLGHTRYRNLFLNTGHGHMGWTMSCGSARILADVIAGRTPGLSLEGMSLG
ncbi:MAG: D-amino acid dehydrogenase [Nitrospinae bacterium]|nr:D-amino acid dehydrogenase [Nitrospinota bacterium]